MSASRSRTTTAAHPLQTTMAPATIDLSALAIDMVNAAAVTDAIACLTEATITTIADHLNAREGAVAAAVRILIDADVITQGQATTSGHATYVTLEHTPASV